MNTQQVTARFLQVIEYWRNRDDYIEVCDVHTENCPNCLARLCTYEMVSMLHHPVGEPKLAGIAWQPIVVVKPAPVDDLSRVCPDCDSVFPTIEDAQRCVSRHKADAAWRA